MLEPMPSPFREMAKLAAPTLMRQGEVRRLRRADVHLEQGVILLPRAKGGARPVILSESARALLQAQLDGQGGPLVFPTPEGRAWSRIILSVQDVSVASEENIEKIRTRSLAAPRHQSQPTRCSVGLTDPVPGHRLRSPR